MAGAIHLEMVPPVDYRRNERKWACQARARSCRSRGSVHDVGVERGDLFQRVRAVVVGK